MPISAPTNLGTVAYAASAASQILTTTAAAPAGATVIVRCATTGNTGTPSCTDSAGNTYTLIRDQFSGTASRPRSVTFASKLTNPLPSGGTITASVNHGTGTGGMAAQYFTGVDTVTDGITGSVSSRTGTITTTNADDLLIGAMSYTSTSTYTEAANFTTLASNTGTTTLLFGAYRILSAIGTYGWQPTMGSSRNFAWQIFTLKATPAASAFTGFGVPL